MAKIKNQKHPVSRGVITVYNGNRVILEGVECILFCDSERMKIKSKGTFEITGEKLFLQELGNDNIAVNGMIKSIQFGA